VHSSSWLRSRNPEPASPKTTAGAEKMQCIHCLLCLVLSSHPVDAACLASACVHLFKASRANEGLVHLFKASCANEWLRTGYACLPSLRVGAHWGSDTHSMPNRCLQNEEALSNPTITY
jgi:hypothetical protein